MNTIQEIENDMVKNKERVRLARLVDKLMLNREFKELIINGFCTEDCARNAQLSTDTRLSDSDRADALGNAQAPGYLIRYLKFIEIQGRQAERDLGDSEAALEELRAEEAAE